MKRLFSSLSHRAADWSRRSGWFRPATIGERGERVAADFLKQSGLKIITRGFRNRSGEIDVIALDSETVVFVEVKTHRNHSAGHPAEAVDARKQAQLGRLAIGFRRQHRLMQYPARFDVIAVTWPDVSAEPNIEHFRDAFALPAVGSTNGQS